MSVSTRVYSALHNGQRKAAGLSEEVESASSCVWDQRIIQERQKAWKHSSTARSDTSPRQTQHFSAGTPAAGAADAMARPRWALDDAHNLYIVARKNLN